MMKTEPKWNETRLGLVIIYTHVKNLNITNTIGWMKNEKNKQTKTNSLIPKQLSEQTITPEDMNNTTVL
jgi:hypothetical protein